ncbi:hypothetical protein RHMOL_Rhmol06G0191700 [Rhododendron molle]|uniref:Uncharacterized protein n=1 Tax=Rhododendron molle TaxID=49168 RepID=A0ACC0NFV9_RHOML|nr:hypothetical protein RHMOL_Rhmol06G0191700 [Rhododendron molle]
MRGFMCKKKETVSSITPLANFDEMDNDEDIDEDEFDVQSKTPPKRPASASYSSQGFTSKLQSKKPKTKWPMDFYFTPDPEIEVENRKRGKQPKVDENTPYKKDLKERLIKLLRGGSTMPEYLSMLSMLDSFERMLEAIGQYGPGLTPPSYYQVCVPLLKKRGSMFVESVDASGYSTTGDKMYKLLDNFVEQIGEANVVQVVTDSAATNVMAGNNELPYVSYYSLVLFLTLLLILIVLVLTCDREVVNGKKTTFCLVLLDSMRYPLLGFNVRRHFQVAAFEEDMGKGDKEAWSKSKWGKEVDGKKVAEIMLSPLFWNNVLLALRFTCPLVKVLRLVYDEEKPAMGYIYEAMDRAIETIINTFGEDEDKHNSVS